MRRSSSFFAPAVALLVVGGVSLIDVRASHAADEALAVRSKRVAVAASVAPGRRWRQTGVVGGGGRGGGVCSPNFQAVTGTLIRISDITEGRTTTVGRITTALILTAPRRFISQRTRSWSGDKCRGGWGAM